MTNLEGNMQVLLIGGTGTLSSDTTRLCIQKGYEVYLFNRGHRNIFSGDNVHYLIGDINNFEQAKNIIRDYQFDVVVDYLTFSVDILKSRINLFNEHCKQYIFISRLLHRFFQTVLIKMFLLFRSCIIPPVKSEFIGI